MVKRILKICRRNWEWGALAFILINLALFLTGVKIFAFSDLTSAILAFITALLAPILSFLLATLILPLLALAVGIITALLTLVTGLAALLIGGIFTPIVAILTGWLGTLVAWLAGTWLGTLLTPVYSLLAPVVLKITPFLTTSKYAVKAYRWAQKRLTKPRRKPRHPPAAANQSGGRGRSSVRAKRHRDRARAKR